MRDHTHVVQVLTLLPALSSALNVAFAVSLTARRTGAGPAQPSPADSDRRRLTRRFCTDLD